MTDIARESAPGSSAAQRAEPTELSEREFWTDTILERLDGETEERRISPARLLPSCFVESRRAVLESWLVDARRPHRFREAFLRTLDVNRRFSKTPPSLVALSEPTLEALLSLAIDEGRGMDELLGVCDEPSFRTRALGAMPIEQARRHVVYRGGMRNLKGAERRMLYERLAAHGELDSACAMATLDFEASRAMPSARKATPEAFVDAFADDVVGLRAALRDRPDVLRDGAERFVWPMSLLLEIESEQSIRVRATTQLGRKQNLVSALRVVEVLVKLGASASTLDALLSRYADKGTRKALLRYRVAMSAPLADAELLLEAPRWDWSLPIVRLAASSKNPRIQCAGIARMVDHFPSQVSVQWLNSLTDVDEPMIRTIVVGALAARGDARVIDELKGLASHHANAWVQGRALADLRRCPMSLPWRWEVLRVGLSDRRDFDDYYLPVPIAAATSLRPHRDFVSREVCRTLIDAHASVPGNLTTTGIENSFAAWMGEPEPCSLRWWEWCASKYWQFGAQNAESRKEGMAGARPTAS